MIHRFIIPGLFGLIALFTGCTTATERHPKVEAKQGLIYIYRKEKPYDTSESYFIKQNDRIIGLIPRGSYFYVFSEPGAHSYSIFKQPNSSRTLHVEGGKTYYIECSFERSVLGDRLVLRTSNQAEAELVLPRLIVLPVF